jgi:hypothetical protein
VDVDAAASRCAQEFFRQDTAVSDDDGDVRVVRRKELFRFVGFNSLWLLNREAVCEREFFNG